MRKVGNRLAVKAPVTKLAQSIPQPESPPPRAPIPKPSAHAGGTGTFTCSICRKSFNSKDELELHIETDHKARRR
jgi:hypothetical protein